MFSYNDKNKKYSYYKSYFGTFFKYISYFVRMTRRQIYP
jgi:hypothetical protein